MKDTEHIIRAIQALHVIVIEQTRGHLCGEPMTPDCETGCHMYQTCAALNTLEKSLNILEVK